MSHYQATKAQVSLHICAPEHTKSLDEDEDSDQSLDL